MGSHADKPPLVVIIGPTASGKSALATKLARHFDIEVIAADARTVYSGMDIGTAKPTPKEQHDIPHHLLDIVSPDQAFTVADFKQCALEKIDQIARRGKLPVMVGGSGLYVYAVLYDFAFRGAVDNVERDRLSGLPVEMLQGLIRERGLPMPSNDKNPRHLISAIQTGTVIKQPRSLRANTLLLGLDVDIDRLAAQIHHRTKSMMAAGLEQEVRGLVERYGWGAVALHQTIGYEEFRPYFSGDSSIDAVVQQIQLHTRRLAKRQRTWFRHNLDIHWIYKTEDAVDLVTTFLNK